VYVDTVGPAEKYEVRWARRFAGRAFPDEVPFIRHCSVTQEKLNKIFADIKIKVSKKADSLFPVVSAASICAKVIRDIALKNWKFSENIKIDEKTDWGSGYPGGQYNTIALFRFVRRKN
jgi:ribonuclease HII